jgi:hypothetical protein
MGPKTACMVGLMWPKETGAKGNSNDVQNKCASWRQWNSRAARSSCCTVWLLWQQYTGATMIILNMQKYHSSRRRSNVRAVRSSGAPAARSAQINFLNYVMYVIYSMLQGHSRHNIIVMEDGRKEHIYLRTRL